MSGSLTPKGVGPPLYSILGAALCLFPQLFVPSRNEKRPLTLDNILYVFLYINLVKYSNHLNADNWTRYLHTTLITSDVDDYALWMTKGI